MSLTLSDIFGTIDAYDKIQKDFGFTAAGTGRAPWSHQFINAAGNVLTVWGNGWTLHTSTDVLIAKGSTPAELKKVILSDLSYEALLEYAAR